MSARPGTGSGIDPQNIKYITFEGGGGKGNAYLGALKALEDLGMLDKIQGVSGASAGAITSLLVGTDHSFDEIKKIISGADFIKDLLDSAIQGKGITLKEGKSKDVGAIAHDNYDVSQKGVISQSMFSGMGIAESIQNYTPTGMLSKMLTGDIIDYLIDNEALADKFAANMSGYMECLYYDYGFFSGIEIHKWLNSILRAKIKEKSPKGHEFSENSGGNNEYSPFPTFAEIDGLFSKTLKFTAVNFRTQQLHILSRETTPDLPVATAARMSMNLPFIFKPVKKEGSSHDTLRGLWLDGGIMNNAPVKVFEDEGEQTLLFRLGNRKIDNTYPDFLDFLKGYFGMTVMGGAGVGRLSSTTWEEYYSNIIELGIGQLDTLDFDAKGQLEQLIKINEQITKSALE